MQKILDNTINFTLNKIIGPILKLTLPYHVFIINKTYPFFNRWFLYKGQYALTLHTIMFTTVFTLNLMLVGEFESRLFDLICNIVLLSLYFITLITPINLILKQIVDPLEQSAINRLRILKQELTNKDTKGFPHKHNEGYHVYGIDGVLSYDIPGVGFLTLTDNSFQLLEEKKKYNILSEGYYMVFNTGTTNVLRSPSYQLDVTLHLALKTAFSSPKTYKLLNMPDNSEKVLTSKWVEVKDSLMKPFLETGYTIDTDIKVICIPNMKYFYNKNNDLLRIHNRALGNNIKFEYDVNDKLCKYTDSFGNYWDNQMGIDCPYIHKKYLKLPSTNLTMHDHGYYHDFCAETDEEFQRFYNYIIRGLNMYHPNLKEKLGWSSIYMPYVYYNYGLSIRHKNLQESDDGNSTALLSYLVNEFGLNGECFDNELVKETAKYGWMV